MTRIAPVELITPWWRGINADHLYWYCPRRSGEISADVFGSCADAYEQITVHGLHPHAGQVCPWCVRRYNGSLPVTENSLDQLIDEGWLFAPIGWR